MKRLLTTCLFLINFTLIGCATTGTDGIVEISPNLYMHGGLGSFTDMSSSGVKARLYKDAAQFCSAKGLAVSPVSDTGRDSGVGTYASAEIKFRCVAK
jgi:hypothetical protein